MSIDLDIRKRYIDGDPILFWANRKRPLIIGAQTVAHSGRVCIVRNVIASQIGKPMRVKFILAKKAHLDTWDALIDSSPFNTTSLASYFSTGHTVVFNQTDPIVERAMVVRDQYYDLDQTIFDSGNEDYRAGEDLFAGMLNLIIMT